MSDGRFAGHFDAIAAALAREARAGEAVFAFLRAERSDFLRFNRARVRQAGTVERAVATIRLFAHGRQAQMRCTLGAPRGVRARVREALVALRAALERLPVDPHAAFERTPGASEHVVPANAAEPEQAIEAIVEAAGDDDLVGLYAAGPVVRALASNLGHRHYHEVPSSSFDFSIHVPGGQAVKSTWSAPGRDDASLRRTIAQARERAIVLARPVRRIEPGAYRALLAPAALADLVALLGWGGFSERALRSGQSPLARAQRGEARFDASFALVDDLDALDVPRFQCAGYLRGARTALVEAGCPAQRLVSPRSALEFGVPTDGAEDDERPRAACVHPGRLDDARAWAALDTGVAIANLWYLNWSDRQACRATGMTRFATVWVENGVPVAPLAPMRFDDSLYRVFGAGRVAFTDRVETIPQLETWDGREPGGVRAPSALVDALRFTL